MYKWHIDALSTAVPTFTAVTSMQNQAPSRIDVCHKAPVARKMYRNNSVARWDGTISIYSSSFTIHSPAS